MVIVFPKEEIKRLTPDQQRGRLIAAACELSGLSQSQLAARIFITPRQLRNYLTGKSSLDADKLEAIANATGQPLEAFRLTPVER